MALSVPRAAREGHSVTLGCEYDLEGAPLYSVKWYRDSAEFYRYVPKEEPPTRVFTLPGLHVDVSVSNAHNVTLLSVTRNISGLYQCEVSADAPRFHTQMMSAPMTVAVVPVGVPVVTVDRTGLEHGRPLIADCHAPASYPAANITFFVNEEKVPGYTSEWTSAGAAPPPPAPTSGDAADNDVAAAPRPRPPATEAAAAAASTPPSPWALERKTARLELSGVGGSWGELRLRCEASLFRLYRAASAEVGVRPDAPQPASVLLMGPTAGAVPPTATPGSRRTFNILLLLLALSPRLRPI